MRNDEAIYSYAVERMVDTNDWLTPRSIPTDWPFFEKPPLKFWMVAAGIESGVLPRNETGLRFLDGLFGGLSLLYVFAIGAMLGGPLCGIVAGLVLFTLDPLLFEHGFRSNNMEASVVLGYAGGVYHFARWVQSSMRARGHAFAFAGFFFLAFMTKLVAALFLPAVCLAAFAWGGHPVDRLKVAWKDWVLPVLLFVVLAAPWFIYHSITAGREFWNILIGEHVYKRFTASLDPSHLHPWHYYFSETWRELGNAGSQVVVGLGVVFLVYAAVRERSWIARLVFMWGALPLIAISIGTSKLLHYAYPFWPPVALGAGLVVARAVKALDGPLASRVAASMGQLMPVGLQQWVGTAARPRRIVGSIAAVALAIAVITAIVGPWTITIGSVHLFSNSSVLRPLVFGTVLLMVVGYALTVVRMVGAIALILLLPFGKYVEKIQHMSRVDHPLQATRDCMARINASRGLGARGALSASGDILHHSYYFYFWRQGPWVVAKEFSPDQVEQRLTDPGQQTPIFVAKEHFQQLANMWSVRPTAPNGQPNAPALEGRAAALWDGVTVEENIALLLPGPYRACIQPLREAGALQLWRPTSSTREK